MCYLLCRYGLVFVQVVQVCLFVGCVDMLVQCDCFWQCQVSGEVDCVGVYMVVYVVIVGFVYVWVEVCNVVFVYIYCVDVDWCIDLFVQVDVNEIGFELWYCVVDLVKFVCCINDYVDVVCLCMFGDFGYWQYQFMVMVDLGQQYQLQVWQLCECGFVGLKDLGMVGYCWQCNVFDLYVVVLLQLVYGVDYVVVVDVGVQYLVVRLQVVVVVDQCQYCFGGVVGQCNFVGVYVQQFGYLLLYCYVLCWKFVMFILCVVMVYFGGVVLVIGQCFVVYCVLIVVFQMVYFVGDVEVVGYCGLVVFIVGQYVWCYGCCGNLYGCSVMCGSYGWQ